MAFGMNKSRLTPIAIDFGVDTIKMLQVATGESTQLIGAGCLVVPENARKDSAARYAFLADAVKELVRQQPFKGRRAMCAIPAFQTFMNTFELQCGEKDDIDAQVNLHLQTTMDTDPSRMVIRNQRVGSVIRDGVTRQRAICSAASRAVVIRYLEIAAAAKLEVVGMHSEPVCITKCFSELYNSRDPQKDEARCFVDIGAASAKLVIVQDHKIMLARNIAVAGDELTRQHAKKHRVGFSDARLARHREAGNPFTTALGGTETKVNTESNTSSVGVLDDAEVAPKSQGVMTTTVPSELDKVFDKLIDDIRLSIRYHDSVCTDTPVKRIVLLGGEAMYARAAQTVARQIGLPTFIGDPMACVMRTPGLETVNLDTKQPQPGWAVPLGLSLSEANL